MKVFDLISVCDHVFKGWLRLMVQREVESPGEASAPGRWLVALGSYTVGPQLMICLRY